MQTNLKFFTKFIFETFKNFRKMKKILGLDLGTDSIGWTIVQQNEEKKFKLIDKGVRIFQKGVGEEKNNEFSLAKERTTHRNTRKKYRRTKQRKVRLLRELIKHGMCPLSFDELELWSKYRKGKPYIYPLSNKGFTQWLKLNPYDLRERAIKPDEKLTPLELGRIFYHITQRRGFKSNRKDNSEDSEGVVKTSISQLREEMEGKTLGQFFNNELKKGNKVRKKYTAREDYHHEFNEICNIQKIDNKTKAALEREIFFQRALKSQRHLVGKCTLEPKKPRCPLSAIPYEEFRALQFINSIRIKDAEENLMPLTQKEREVIQSLFFRKSKPSFPFNDIKKILEKHNGQRLTFNYPEKLQIIGSPTIALLKSVFGEEWASLSVAYTKKDGTTGTINSEDVWHALFEFEHNDKLEDFLKQRLKLSDDNIQKLIKGNLKQGYASLSRKAINNILPFLKDGHIYTHAVFLAKIPEIIGRKQWLHSKDQIVNWFLKSAEELPLKNRLCKIVNNLITEFNETYANADPKYILDDSDKKSINRSLQHDFGPKTWNKFSSEKKDELQKETERLFLSQINKGNASAPYIKPYRQDEELKQYLIDNFNIKQEEAERIYHPSAIDIFDEAPYNDDGIKLLQSPRTPSARNPMAMRALHELRYLLNQLLSQRGIDEHTVIHLEMSRELNNQNKRLAIQRYQQARNEEHQEYAKEIKKIFKEQTQKEIEPTEADILKYRLWKEQEHNCLYTGRKIGIADFIGDNSNVDIEHTWPRSKSFDNSTANKTLCDSHYNRNIKKNKIPYDLPNFKESAIIEGKQYDPIKARLKDWEEKCNHLKELAAKYRYNAKRASTKEQKDKALQNAHFYQMHHEYWKDKIFRFTGKEIRNSFKNSQLVDTGIINKYARAYLQTVFNKVFTIKGTLTADFRKAWGIQNPDTSKSRQRHTHHAIDAAVVACLTRDRYDFLTQWYRAEEKGNERKKHIIQERMKPWTTFVQDIKAFENSILVSHHTRKTSAKQTRKRLRENGKIVKDPNGNPIYSKGDTFRNRLHKDTFYGAILRPQIDKEGKTVTDENGNPKLTTQYVVKKPVTDLKETDIKNIVDSKIKSLFESKKLNEIQKEGISIPPSKPEGKETPIKSVRLKQPFNPIPLREHTHLSQKPHKQYYHVQNEGNFLMAIYEETSASKKPEKTFELISNLQAADYYKASNKENREQYPIVPERKFITKRNKEIELPLKQIIYIGQMVMLYENSPEELKSKNEEELFKCLYKIVGITSMTIQAKYEYGVFILKHHAISTPYSELKPKDGDFSWEGNIEAMRKQLHSRIKVVIENLDFKITPTGKIEWLF